MYRFPILRNLASVGLGWGPGSYSFSKCPLVISVQVSQWLHLEWFPYRPPLPSNLTLCKVLITFKIAIWICLSLWWILDKGVANKVPVTVGCDSHGITPHHIMYSVSHHFCCCHQPSSFPLSLPPCHHQRPLLHLPLTLKGWVISIVEHLTKHILEDRLKVSSFYIHNSMSGNKGTSIPNPSFLWSSANLVKKLGPWFEVPAAFYFTMSENQNWVTDLLPKY